jgi:Uncharacterized conserved protein
MKIYTSYFANLKNIPKDVFPISISLRPPKGYNGLEYKVLAPSNALLSAWHKNHDETYYRQVFCNKLDALNANDIVAVLEYMSKGKDVVLVCYERPENFCHRHLVAEWLCKNGYETEEIVL